MVLPILFAAGCSSEPSSTNGGLGVTRNSYAVFSASVVLRGEMTVQGKFVDTVTSRHESCDAYAHGLVPATTIFVVPTPNDASDVNGHIITYTAGVPITPASGGYRGPGTYSAASALVSVLLIDNASYLPGDEARSTITIAGDGSGSLSFTGLLDVSTDAEEAGTVRWTCAG